MDPALSQLTSVLEQMHERVRRLETGLVMPGSERYPNRQSHVIKVELEANGLSYDRLKTFKGDDTKLDVYWFSDSNDGFEAYNSIVAALNLKLKSKKLQLVYSRHAHEFECETFHMKKMKLEPTTPFRDIVQIRILKATVSSA